MKHTPANHEEWENLIAIAALEGLEPAESAALERHLATCADCRQALADYRHVAAQLDQMIPLVTAPAHLEQRLLGQIRRPARRSPLRWLAAVATVVALLLGGYSWNLRGELQRQTSALAELQRSLAGPNARLIPLSATSNVAARGQFTWTPGQAVASLVVEGLPLLEPGHVYQLWLVRKDGTIDPAGTFSQAAEGEIRATVRAPVGWSNYANVGISAEPASAPKQPSSTGIVQGDF
ncbi:MAG: anti-sigma factor [Herpetosiphonaceae bacterium]|nr:anti-sigma factor [Herpetosiphonaceae bacterium]